MSSSFLLSASAMTAARPFLRRVASQSIAASQRQSRRTLSSFPHRQVHQSLQRGGAVTPSFASRRMDRVVSLSKHARFFRSSVCAANEHELSVKQAEEEAAVEAYVEEAVAAADESPFDGPKFARMRLQQKIDRNSDGFVPSLFLTNIAGDLTAEQIRASVEEIFTPIGALARVHVPVDAVTGKTRGFAFINYVLLEDAQRAIRELHKTEIGGNSCYLKWGNGGGHIYVGGLGTECSEEKLREIFAGCGRIYDVQVAMDRATNEPRGYGFVRFVGKEHEVYAIEKLDGTMVDGKKMDVRRYVRGGIQLAARNLPADLDAIQIREMFSVYGEVDRLTLVSRKPDAPPTQGRIAFITYLNVEDGIEAQAKMEGMQVDGMHIHVDRALPKEEFIAKKNERKKEQLNRATRRDFTHPEFFVFVQNLPKNVDEEALFKLMGTVGELGPDSRVGRNRDGTQQMFCRVEYKSAEDATAALAQLNNAEIEGNKLAVKPHIPKPRRTGTHEPTKLYLSNVSGDSTVESITEAFSKYGTVLRTSIPENSYGLAFVEYQFEKQAEEAIKGLNNTEVDGREIVVRPARTRMRQGEVNNEREADKAKMVELRKAVIHMGNIPFTETLDSVLKVVHDVGGPAPVDLNLPKDESQRSRGFGFLQYASVEEAKEATKALRAAQLTINNRPILINMPGDRDDREI
eukprot:TRINITY_DN725_c0_g1_i1.p1 TRINITY_DN725_c0_g1~~TRINITY_DN725_c0_g1_i1.p1  ORF type:complete len:738 (+),score=151.02 TRINITY_DN725_c0_g1_i1:152-2215(+)